VDKGGEAGLTDDDIGWRIVGSWNPVVNQTRCLGIGDEELAVAQPNPGGARSEVW